MNSLTVTAEREQSHILERTNAIVLVKSGSSWCRSNKKLTFALRANLLARSRNKFDYNAMTACITNPALYCSASRKPITWTKGPHAHGVKLWIR